MFARCGTRSRTRWADHTDFVFRIFEKDLRPHYCADHGLSLRISKPVLTLIIFHTHAASFSKYVSSLPFRSLLFAARHGPRRYFTHYTISLSDQGTFFLTGHLTVSSTTGLDSPHYDTTSPCQCSNLLTETRTSTFWHPR